MLGGREEGTLGVVAAGVSRDEVVEPVIGVARPRDEVVDLDAASHRGVTVEASPGLEFLQIVPHRVERGASDAEQELVEIGVVEQAAVEPCNRQRPVALDQWPQEASEADEVISGVANQPKLAVEPRSIGFAAGDRTRPADLIDERLLDGAYLLQPRQWHLDEFPLYEGHELLPGDRGDEAGGRERLGCVADATLPEPGDATDDLGLSTVVLLQHAAVRFPHVAAGVRPVQRDDLLGEVTGM